VRVVGHTKFDQEVPSLTPEEGAALRAGFGLAPEQPLFLAGSTHEGEEEIILEAWEIARRSVPKLALMLAPRHLSRVDAVRAVIERRGLSAHARSEVSFPGFSTQHGGTEIRRGRDGVHRDRQDEQDNWIESASPQNPVDPVHPCSNPSVSPCLRVHSETDVLLLDTMGELAKLYGLAAVAFVGGSLVPKGGHDLLQPLFHRVPTLYGPYMHNQRTLVELASGERAAWQVADAASLAAALVCLLTDDEARAAMQAAAARLLAANRGASARCAAVVAELVQS